MFEGYAIIYVMDDVEIGVPTPAITTYDFIHIGVGIPLETDTKRPILREVHNKFLSREDREVLLAGHDWDSEQLESAVFPTDQAVQPIPWGIVPSDEYIIIDIDAHGQNENLKRSAFEELKNLGWFPETFHVSRRFEDGNYISGHYYYKMPTTEFDSAISVKGWLKYESIKVGDIKYRGGYVVAPGSYVVDEDIDSYYTYLGDPNNIPEIHPDLLAYITTNTVVEDVDLDNVTEEQRRQALSNLMASKFKFSSITSPGERDDLWMGYIRDLGQCVALELIETEPGTSSSGLADVSELDDEKEFAFRLAQRVAENTDDPHIFKQLTDKWDYHLTYGRNNVRVVTNDDSLDDSWWFDDLALHECWQRALAFNVSPYMLLMMELTALSSATDHRVKVRSYADTSHMFNKYAPTLESSPIIWLLVYGPPGSDKSSSWIRVRQQMEAIPNLPPPPPIKIYYDDERSREQWSTLAFNYKRATHPVPVISETTSRNGLAAAFLSPFNPIGPKGGREAAHGRKRQDSFRALFYFDEPKDLFNDDQEKRGTLNQFTKSYYGGELRNIVGGDTGYWVEAGRYSVNKIINCQPTNSGLLLKYEGTGFMERYLAASPIPDPFLADVMEKLRDEGIKLNHAFAHVKEWQPHNIRDIEDIMQTAQERMAAEQSGDQTEVINVGHNGSDNITVLLSSPQAIKELQKIDKWAKRRIDMDDYEIPESFKPLLDTGSDELRPAWQHMGVKLERLSALLARYCGEELPDKKSWTIPYKYYQISKHLVRYSSMILKNLRIDSAKVSTERNIYVGKRAAEREELVEEARQKVKIKYNNFNSPEEYLVTKAYKDLADGPVRWSHFQSNLVAVGKMNGWWETAAEAKSKMEATGLFNKEQLNARPAMVAWSGEDVVTPPTT